MNRRTIRPHQIAVGDVLSNGTDAPMGTVTRVETFANGCVAVEWVNPLGESKVQLHGAGSSVTVLGESRLVDADVLLERLEREGDHPDTGVRFGLRLAVEFVKELLP